MSLLEEFLESAQFLPIELQRSCLLIQEIDEKSKCLESEVAELQQQYLEGLEKGNREQVDEHNNLMEQIKQKHLKSIHYADEKINNINCLHEFVEKYVKLLDDKIRKIEEEQKNQEEVYTYDYKKQFPQTVPGPSPYKKRQTVTSKEISFPEDKPFMPDEINEEEFMIKAEKYCTCLKNTGGEMIGCDNKNCKYQWFHFECVGITQQPKGKWYCPECKIKKEAQFLQIIRNKSEKKGFILKSINKNNVYKSNIQLPFISIKRKDSQKQTKLIYFYIFPLKGLEAFRTIIYQLTNKEKRNKVFASNISTQIQKLMLLNQVSFIMLSYSIQFQIINGYLQLNIFNQGQRYQQTALNYQQIQNTNLLYKLL